MRAFLFPVHLTSVLLLLHFPQFFSLRTLNSIFLDLARVVLPLLFSCPIYKSQITFEGKALGKVHVFLSFLNFGPSNLAHLEGLHIKFCLPSHMTPSKTWLRFPVSYFLLRFFFKSFRPYTIYLSEKAFEVKHGISMYFPTCMSLLENL